MLLLAVRPEGQYFHVSSEFKRESYTVRIYSTEKVWSMSLLQQLPKLLPGAIAWAEVRARKACEIGEPLSLPEHMVARMLGVMKPELVRVEIVERLPLPEEPELRAAALQAGLLGPDMTGLTLGHAIFVCRGHKTRRLLSHELRHVYQYEQAGSIALFLPVYLRQVLEVGYRHAPLEMDARAHELSDSA